MRAHLEGLASHLSPLGVRIHLYRANNAPGELTERVPYIVLAGGWSPGEESMSGPAGSRTSDIVITCVDDRASNAALLASRVLTLLPLGEWVRLPVPGHVVDVKCTESRPVEVDLDIRLPNSNLHPGVGHILLDLRSTPRS